VQIQAVLLKQKATSFFEKATYSEQVKSKCPYKEMPATESDLCEQSLFGSF
jgi:hypothetical protein